MRIEWSSPSPVPLKPAMGAWVGLTVFILAALCGPGRALAQEPSDLVGVIFDHETQAPVSGVLVQVQGTSHRALTDSVGVFRINRIAPGEYTFVFRKLGYEDGEARVYTIPGEPLFVALIPQPIVLEGITVQANQLESRLRKLPYSSVAFDEMMLRGSAAPNAWLLLRNLAGLLETSCASQQAGNRPYSELRRPEFERLMTTDDFLTLPGSEVLDTSMVRMPMAPDPLDTCILSRGRVIRPIVCIDERTAFGVEDLMHHPVDDIYRIEVIRAGQMIRLYTSWFIESVSMGRRRLPTSISPAFC